MLSPAAVGGLIFTAFWALVFSVIAGRLVQGAWRSSYLWEAVAALAMTALATLVWKGVTPAPYALVLVVSVAIAVVSPGITRFLTKAGFIKKLP